MDLDPTYYPPMEARSLKFGPDDLVNDDGDLTLTGARYQAAWRLFGQTERPRGKSDVCRWADGVTSVAGRVQTDQIVQWAKKELRTDIAPMLQ